MNSWKDFLDTEKEKDYFLKINNFLSDCYKENKVIYPKKEDIFNAFEKTPLDKVKVVIVGQDPYHNKNQAMGLSFSIPKETKKIPPSLKNIYKELKEDLSIEKDITHGDLTKWTKEGVLLLNGILTVEEHKPNSHSKIGWETLTSNAIKMLNDSKDNIVFILWGAYAQKKIDFIDEKRHLVIKSPHPSPFSARKGFFKSKCFSRTNDYLISKKIKPVDWILD